jgi:mono/diheme cytochrome c family protein
MMLRPVIPLVAVLGLTSCNNLPGRPGPHPEVIRPEEVLDFATLYTENCSGCHGTDGKGNAAIALKDPTYLAIADDSTIRNVTSRGVRATPMPPFAKSMGGVLTDQQIDVIVGGIRAWARSDSQSDTPRDAALPPYSAPTSGDPKRGAEVYATFCSSCHGASGQGAKGGSSIVNGSYLALVSDQYLRTIVIAGRRELGAPDWRANVQGRPMSAQEITDVVAWLASQRSRYPGQPYTASAQWKR